ncbi:MAG: acyltransferase [Bacteroidetes bacterium]|nr:acyltransferase [Bacteroidota bacterium]MBU1719960.1 acyltransferase [Bacteroidota bacterium]
MSNLKTSRIETLDWLRGLMALSIMFYHLTYRIISPLDLTSPLGRLGVYGVSIFFVLSGLSMAIVYNTYISSLRAALNFYVRRIFRIWPMMWAVCILAILPQILTSGTYDWKLLFLNLTTLFGFVDPTAYIATGAWSIGNEMVYYALTPMIFLLYNYKKWIGNVFFMVCLGVGLYFAFFVLDPSIGLSNQWALYVNPFNNLFLYVMGIAIYYNLRDVNIHSAFNIVLLVSAILLFFLLPYEGNQIAIASGFGRVVFVTLSFIIVFCFYKLKINLPVFLKNALGTFGIATYGVYLIHPIAYYYISFALNKLHFDNGILTFCLIVVLTIVVSVFSYNFFELKLIKLGKRLTSTAQSK